MILNKLISSSFVSLNRLTAGGASRHYTVIVERYRVPGLTKRGVDQRKAKLTEAHFHYKHVETLHIKKWGNTDVILTQYVEGLCAICVLFFKDN
jgi:hypothetical protein